jgi:hypothetical protein
MEQQTQRRHLQELLATLKGPLMPVAQDECSLGFVVIETCTFLMMRLHDDGRVIRLASSSPYLSDFPVTSWCAAGFGWMTSASLQRRVLCGDYQKDHDRVGRSRRIYKGLRPGKVKHTVCASACAMERDLRFA